MCAYLTGQIGECEVGEEDAAIFKKEELGIDFEDSLMHLTDEHNCARPAIVYSKKGSRNK